MTVYVMSEYGVPDSYYTSEREAWASFRRLSRHGGEPEGVTAHDAIKLLESKDAQIRRLTSALSLLGGIIDTSCDLDVNEELREHYEQYDTIQSR